MISVVIHDTFSSDSGSASGSSSAFSLTGKAISPNIMINAVRIMTWTISDLLTSNICCAGIMERNNKMVINPLGATNSRGFRGKREIFNWIIRKTKIIATIPAASSKVWVFSTSAVSSRKPNRIKNKARTRKAISMVISLNFWSSTCNSSGCSFFIHFKRLNLCRFPINSPKVSINISEGRL